jgi:triphosphoribosyl-dephospho-CoA synthase
MVMSVEPTNLKTIPIGVAATLAVIKEVTAPKPGNVHRGADFEDATYLDFVQSAVVVGPIVERVAELGVGATVLEGVRATQEAVGTNTNLGTLLLMAPLAAVLDGVRHAEGIGRVLRKLTFEDTRHVFEAIRVSAAGGLGRAEEADVFEAPPTGLSLVDAMRMASERDLVARQYCNDFADVCGIASWIQQGVARGWPLDTAIVHAHVRQLAKEADSLIVRKCGPQVGEQARAMAGRVLDAGLPGEDAYQRGLEDFDFWLRSDGHRRNPGTTADLIAAALFVLLREGRVRLKR